MNEFKDKRIGVLIAFFTIVAALLGWRLFDKQVLEHDVYMAKADNQYNIKKVRPKWSY